MCKKREELMCQGMGELSVLRRLVCIIPVLKKSGGGLGSNHTESTIPRNADPAPTRKDGIFPPPNTVSSGPLPIDTSTYTRITNQPSYFIS